MPGGSVGEGWWGVRLQRGLESARSIMRVAVDCRVELWC
jgi:hypothetical protein